MALWDHRLFLMSGDGKFADVLEREVYNGILSGVSLSGDRFFYQNPLVSTGRAERQPYFDVACCPANLSRLLGQLPGLIYAQRDRTFFVNLFVGSAVTIGSVSLTQQTAYPWNGRVTVRVDPSAASTFTVALRVPGWARGEAAPGGLYRFLRSTDASRSIPLSVNGRPVPLSLDRGYARITRLWKRGEMIQPDPPMPIERVAADDRVLEDRGKTAIQRGPLVYCLEGIDNGGHVLDRTLPIDAALTHHFDPAVAGGVDVIRGGGITAIPYYAWNNRGRGEMTVWVAQ